MAKSSFFWKVRKIKQINDVLEKVLEKDMLNVVERKLILNWKLIIRDSISNLATPIKVKYYRNVGTLHLGAVSGGMATKIFYMQDAILERVNAFFGYNAISNIKVIQSSVGNNGKKQIDKKIYMPNKEHRKLTEDIADNTLKEALQSLGDAIV